MKTHLDKKQDSGQRTSDTTSQRNNSQPTFQFVDNRPEALLQRKLQEGANNSPQNQEQQIIQQVANNSPQSQQAVQFQSMADNHTAQEPSIQKKENKTGLPDNLKSGIENLSGYSMDDVKVHYNSEKPAQLQAHAYAQGTDIHLGAGQEKHLPHEAWHVVQQKQGRVKPTMQMKEKVNINDDVGLEKEADVMGGKAISNTQQTKYHIVTQPPIQTVSNRNIIVQREVIQNPAPWGPDQGKWLTTLNRGVLFATQQEAQEEENRILQAQADAEENAWEAKANNEAWTFFNSSKRHFNDGWGDLYGITSVSDLRYTILENADYDEEVGNGKVIDLGKYGHADEHVLRPCNIIYNVTNMKTITYGNITRDVPVRVVFHCGPSNL